jgi:hypothetical protein
MANPFLDKLNNTELMSAFGVTQDNAPLTPEQLATLSQQVPEPEIKQPVVKAAPAAPKQEQSVQPKNSDMQNAMNALENWQNRPKEASQSLDQSTAPAPEKPLSKLDQLEAMMKELQATSSKDLEEARKSDRMLKIGGALGDALATYLNAQGQMNVKAPGVQVQQGAGLGKVADMFATAPEITSDIAAKREALMKQYGELAKGERAEKRLTSEEKLAKDRMAQQERLAEEENQAMLKAAGIRASGKGELTPYQQYMMSKSEKKEAKLSDKQTAELEGLGNVMRSLDEVESAKSGVNTGRYASAYQSGKEALPFSEADQDFVKLRQLSGTQLFDYVKAQSGVSYSVKELEQLKQNMPNVDDDDNTFLTKLNTVRDIVKRKQEEKVKAFQGQGKNVSGFEKQVPTKKASPGDIVTVKGKKYRVAEDGDSLIPVGQ